LTAAARSSAAFGAWRRVGACVLVSSALCGAAQAQFAATLGIDSVNRYRGTGTDDRGPVLRASVMADAPIGAYGGVAGLWRTHDAGLASADAMLGWSGRFDALPALDGVAPDWGWDAAVRRTHYGEGSRYDFSEAMLGLLAPGWTLRSWYAPHYFGGLTHTLYTELDASHAFDDHWRAFGHVGWLHYGPAPGSPARLGDRTDASAGFGYVLERWDVRLSRDGLVGGHARSELDARRRRAAWLLGASVAF
jgi:hypothetical protein